MHRSHPRAGARARAGAARAARSVASVRSYGVILQTLLTDCLHEPREARSHYFHSSAILSTLEVIDSILGLLQPPSYVAT